MGITISFGLQKGGVGKTTVTAITSWLLAEQGKRVLAVDFDSQGNLTQFLTRSSPYDFLNRTVFEACKEQDARPYIHEVSERLHLLPAEDFLSGFSRYLYDEYKPAHRDADRNALNLVLRNTLASVSDAYDFLLVDLPPNLGEQTINGMAASDFCVVILQAEPFSFDALDRYLETVEAVQNRVSPTMRLAGILTSIQDARTSMGQHMLEQAKTEYEHLVFETVIRRKSRIVEYSYEGLQNRTKIDREALEMYESFLQELKQRAQEN